MFSCFHLMHVVVFSILGYLELVKKKARDYYERFASPSSRTAPPPSRQEVGSSSRRHTAPPPTRLGDSSSTCSGYNDEYPHIREVSSYEHCFWILIV
jgi:hypothetical protein